MNCNKVLSILLIGLLIFLFLCVLDQQATYASLISANQQRLAPIQQPAVMITYPMPNQKVPNGNLTVFGTSVDNTTSQCTVYASWDHHLPLQKVFADGTDGINDYSSWNYTYTPDYHEITNGTNNLNSIISCLAGPSNFTKTYSVNITGVIYRNQTNQSGVLATGIDDFQSTSSLNDSSSSQTSFMQSQEYIQGSADFRACIDAAADVGNKLSDYEIENCRGDPSYRHGDGSTDTTSSTSYYSGNSNSDNSPNTSDGGTTTSSNCDGSSLVNIVSDSANDQEFNIGAAGDWANQNNACDTALNMDSKKIDMAIGLGDYAYSSGSKAVEIWWNNIMGPLHGKFKGALGNHDTGDQSTYAQFFSLSGPWYYSFNSHAVHFVALNTEGSYDTGSSQYKFVSNDLASASTNPDVKWIVVFFHKPMYTSPSHHPPLTSFRDVYHPLFDKYGVDLVLQAHNHNYQRTFPISYNNKNPSNPLITSNEKSNYNDPDGEIYTEVGTGGQDSYSLNGKSSFVYQQFTTSGGFLNLAFPTSQTLKGTYYDNGGSIRDEFTIHKSEGQLLTATSDIARTIEDTPIVVPVLRNDNNLDNNANLKGFSLSSAQPAPKHGSVVINSNKTITYLPSQNYAGADSFGYSVSSDDKNRGKSSSNKVTIYVNPVNDPPVANNDSAVLDKGSATAAINLLSNDYDVDGDLLKVSKITPSSSGGKIVNNENGTVTYAVEKDYQGVDTFSYIVSDGRGANDSAQVSVIVQSANTRPLALDQNVTVIENTTTSFKLSAHNSDERETLSYSIVSEPSHGTLDGLDKNSGSLKYTSDENYTGSDTFTFQVTNGKTNSDVGTVWLIVNPAKPSAAELVLPLRSQIVSNSSNASIFIEPSTNATATNTNQTQSFDDRSTIKSARPLDIAVSNSSGIDAIRSTLNEMDLRNGLNDSGIRSSAPDQIISVSSEIMDNSSNLGQTGSKETTSSTTRIRDDIKHASSTQITPSQDKEIGAKEVDMNEPGMENKDEYTQSQIQMQAQRAMKEASEHMLKYTLQTKAELAAQVVELKKGNADIIDSNHPVIKQETVGKRNLESPSQFEKIPFAKTTNKDKLSVSDQTQVAIKQARLELDNLNQKQSNEISKSRDKLTQDLTSIFPIQIKPSPHGKVIEKHPDNNPSDEAISEEKVSGQGQMKAQNARQDHQQSYNKNSKENSNQGIMKQSLERTQLGQNSNPRANAGTDQKIPENTPVILDGTKSFDNNSNKLSYLWTQVKGPVVKLTGATKALSSFRSPTILDGAKNKDAASLEFKLKITDLLNGKQDTDMVKIVVMKKEARDNSLYSANNKRPILSHHEPTIENSDSINLQNPNPNPSLTPRNEGNLLPLEDRALNADPGMRTIPN